MRVFSRGVLAVVLAIALLPVTTFADETAPGANAPTSVDIAQNTGATTGDLSAAINRAATDLATAKAAVDADPYDLAAQARLAAAQANYDQLVGLSGVTLSAPAPVAPATVLPLPGPVVPGMSPQGGPAAVRGGF